MISVAAIFAMAPPAAGQDSEGPTVRISDFQYSPTSITVPIGSTVTWINDGPSAHTATSSDARFDTGLLKSGEQATAEFKQVGNFEYVCTLHPNMSGTVVVQSAGSSLESAPASKEPAKTFKEESAPPPEAAADAQAEDDEEVEKHPRTGADLGLRLLLGVGLLLIGAHSRRLLSTNRV